MDSSVPTILPRRVQVPSMPSTLLSFLVKFVLNLSCEKNENKQKEAGLGPFKKQNKVYATPTPTPLALKGHLRKVYLTKMDDRTNKKCINIIYSFLHAVLVVPVIPLLVHYISST